jgi:hypothetical protein
MAEVKIITVKKAGVESLGWYESPGGSTYSAFSPVPVGTKAAFVRVLPISSDADIEVITSISNGFQGIEFWKLPNSNIEQYIDIVSVQQNPDGSFNPGDYSKLPKWLYTNGVVNKLGPGLIDPEWWKKNKWWIWLVGGLLALKLVDNNKK